MPRPSSPKDTGDLEISNKMDERTTVTKRTSSWLLDHVDPNQEEDMSLPTKIPKLELNSASGMLSGPHVTRNNNSIANQVANKTIRRCETFQERVEIAAQRKLEIKSTHRNKGKATKIMNIAGPSTSVIVGLACGVAVAMGFPTFGIGSFVGVALAGVTLVVTSIDKHMKQSHAKDLEDIEKKTISYYLNAVVKEVAQELSHIYECQLFKLKNEKQVEILAECAVDLMFDLKNNDQFDRDTLLKKVLQDGKMKKKRELLTVNDHKWVALGVLRKPGLRRTKAQVDCAEFTCWVKPGQACDTQTYGYRGQFLEMKNGCETKEDAVEEDEKLDQQCSHKDCGKYFVESSIDSEYTEPCQENLIYHPVYILVQCPKVLDCFTGNLQTEPSLSNFSKKMFNLPNDHIVSPVYRQKSPGVVPRLTGADLTGADFSYSNFTDSSLEGCTFTKCVMLFAELSRAKMSGSTFNSTTIICSNLMGAKADHCSWTKTHLLYSNVEGADLSSVIPTVSGNVFEGTNMDKAYTREEQNTLIPVEESHYKCKVPVAR